MNPKIERALEDLRAGKFVFIYDADGREEETDFTVASELVTPEHIRQMRKDGGGLICSTVYHSYAHKLDLPLIVDLMDRARDRYPLFDELVPQSLPYDTKSAFSLTINHKSNFTGITDNDRASTCMELGKLLHQMKLNGISDQEARHSFAKQFRSPGHLHLLNTSEEILTQRKGHTELSTAMCIMAGLGSSATICEMMGDHGKALSKLDARAYAEGKGLVYLEGFEIIEEWERWSG